MNGSSPDGSGFRTKEEKKMMIAVWGRLCESSIVV